MSTHSYDKRLTIRFTQEEYALLKAKAGDKALSGFVRALVLDEAEAKRKGFKSKPVKDHLALAQILAMVGKSGVFSSMKKLSQASDFGFSDLTEDDQRDVQQACADIAAIKTLLMRSLGVSER